jgi:adenine-specific DNA methylase
MEKNKEELMGHLIPNQRVPWAQMSTMRPRCKVYEHFHDFFNDRQLLSLTMILREILKIEDKMLREFFILTFSDSTNANNMFCIYNAQARKLEPLFGGHYFSPPMMPVENNVWGTKLGRGTFSKYFEKGFRAAQYQEKPFEIQFRDNGNERERTRIFIENDNIDAQIGSNITELQGNSDVILRCTSSERLEFLPDKSIDAVITDPPYYDNIMYSELSNLFYCWMRLGLQRDYPDVFGPPLSGREQEILVQPKTGKGREFFINSMVNVYSEMHRVLKDNGNMIFVFQHKKPETWIALLQILIESRFFIASVYPSHGETPSGVRAHGINYNAILVCRKASNLREVEDSKGSIEKEINLEIHSAAQKHPKLDANDALMMALGKALQVYSQRIVQNSEIDFDLDTLGSLVQSSVRKYWPNQE